MRIFALALVAILAAPAGAQDIDTRPFVMTQGHNNSTQHVTLYRGVQVQLPSNPDGQGDDQIVWSFDVDQNPDVMLTGELHVTSPGRIAGFDTVTVFDFDLVKAGDAVLVLTANAGSVISEDGIYRVTLSAK